jgi:hypothetical protein
LPASERSIEAGVLAETAFVGKELRMVNVDNRGTPRDPRGSNNTLYFIVGALVIAVLIIGWFWMGGEEPDDVDSVTVEESATPPAAGDTNVTVETPAAPAAEPAPAAPATEPAPAAPAEPATPPAGGAMAPAEPATPPAGGGAAPANPQ